MPSPLLYPIRFLGWTAAGLGLAVGWKLGSYLVDVALGEDELRLPFSKQGECGSSETSDASKQESPPQSASDFDI